MCSFIVFLLKIILDNPLALYNVGTLYFSGRGVDQNLEKARTYYEKASMLGFAPAQVSIPWRWLVLCHGNHPRCLCAVTCDSDCAL